MTNTAEPLSHGQIEYLLYIKRRLEAVEGKEHESPPVYYKTFVQIMNDREDYITSEIHNEEEYRLMENKLKAIDTLLFLQRHESGKSFGKIIE